MGEVVQKEFNQEQIQLLKNTICKGISVEEFQIFLHACKRSGLDPFMKQIYAIRRGNQMTIQTSIDGFRLIAERSGKYSPGKEPTYQYAPDGKILCATAYIKKQSDDGTWHDIAATAFWDEYVQPSSPFWKRMPHLMLAKCAESLALRKAFPADLSGLYTEDEMAQANKDIEVVGSCDLITDDQAQELMDILKECSPSYQDRTKKMLEEVKSVDFKGMKKENFEVWKNALCKHREIHLKSLEITNENN